MDVDQPATGTVQSPASGWHPFFPELFKIYRTRFWGLVGMTVLVFVIPIAGALVLAIALTPAIVVILLVFHAQLIFAVALCVILFMAGFLAEIWLGSAAGIAILNVVLHYEDPVDVGGSLKLGFKKAWDYLWLSMFMGFIIVGAFFLFIIPGIFLSIAFSLAGLAFLVEDQRLANAFLRSRDLVKGHWWYVFGCMLAVGTPAFAISLVRIYMGSVGAIVAFVLDILVLPFAFITTVVVFRNLQSLKPVIEPSSTARKWKYALFILPVIALLVVLTVFFPMILKKFSAARSTIGTGQPGATINPLLNTNVLMAQDFDAKRVSDINILKSTIEFYLANGGNFSVCKEKTLYTSAPIFPPTGWRAADMSAGKTAIDGTGWLPFDFASIPSGSPLLLLPLDPVNDPNAGFIYVMICDPANRTFKLETKMQSAAYNEGGSKDVTSNDGGNDPARYEVGTELSAVIPTNFPSSY